MQSNIEIRSNWLLDNSVNINKFIIDERDYIRNNFFHKDTHLRERTGGGFTATDFSSYGATIIVEPIVIS